MSGQSNPIHCRVSHSIDGHRALELLQLFRGPGPPAMEVNGSLSMEFSRPGPYILVPAVNDPFPIVSTGQYVGQVLFSCPVSFCECIAAE